MVPLVRINNAIHSNQDEFAVGNLGISRSEVTAETIEALAPWVDSEEIRDVEGRYGQV